MNRALLGVLVAACAASAFADGPSAGEWAKRAEAALGAGEFEKALEAYKQAEVTLPTSPELAYNRGVVHYKLGEYDDAREYFSKALSTRDLSLEAKCKFNLGNVAYASALERLTDLQQAIDLLKTAMGRYRDALELDSTDEDARENIEKAQLLIKDLLDKLKKQQEEQQKQDNQDQQQQQSEENEDSSGQQQDGEQGEQDQKGGDEGQQEDRQGSPEQEEQEEQEAGAEQQPPAETREMTREEAERMLQAVRDRERQRRKELSKRRMLRRGRVVKDW